VTDPATTPSTVRGQVAFGAGVAAAYGALMSLHVVFGLFFALTFVCAVRGGLLQAQAWLARPAESTVPGPAIADSGA
jgi:enediyne biosynthesis protein E5